MEENSNVLVDAVLRKDSLNIRISERIIRESLQLESLYPELKNTYEEIRPEEKVKLSRILGRITDKLSLAEELISIVPMYYDSSGIFWLWDLAEYKWKMVDEVDILTIVNRACEVNVVNGKERQEIINAIKLVGREKKPKEIGKKQIQFSREVVDLETGDHYPASPKFFCTNPLPHRLSNNTNTPNFDKLFKEWVGEHEVITLYEILAYSMLPDYPIERIFCLYGSGSNGKSCFLKILSNFLGRNNICTTSLELLTRSRFETARLYRKLACVMGETNLQKLENTQIIKNITSGKDPVAMEIKNKMPFDDNPYSKLIIATNNIPPTDDKTDGYYRRWKIVDFPNQFQNDGVDVLSSIPIEEYSNLASKCLLVLDDILKNRKFINDGSIEERKRRYEDRSSPIDKFFSLFVDEEANDDISVRDFATSLNNWLKENRMRELSDMTISSQLKTKGIHQVRLRKEWFENSSRVERMVRCWAGVKWK
jgi:P4 family phage/plasmid primase-like protien